MPEWEIVRHQVAISGRITRGTADEPAIGAAVVIQSAGKTVATAVAAPSGRYYVLDLPDGTYSVSAFLPEAGSRLGTVETTATVSRTPDGKIIMGTADIILPPTTIQGQVTAGGTPVFMAEIRIRGSTEKALSGPDGAYRIAFVEKGSRTLTVTARGFEPASQTVILANAGDVGNVNIALTSL